MIVIGAGSGGLSMALGLHELGIKVLLIEKSDQSIGGECLNTGCIPSKAFIHATKIIHAAHQSKQFGLEVDGQASMGRIWHYVEQAQNKIRSHENANYLRAQGLDIELGAAKFSGKNQVTVNGKEFYGKKITIATGSKPAKIQVPGIEQIQQYNNETIWKLSKIPKTILFVGAGPINLELGQAFARIGSKVIMVELAKRILTKEAEEISQILHQQSLKLGIEFCLESTVDRFTDAHTAVVKQKHHQHHLKFDIAVISVGRKLDFTALNPAAAGISLEKSGCLKLDGYLRTTNKNVLAIGDAANGPQFSHAAELQATTLISNLISPFKKKISYHKFSWVTFTQPEVATFGISEAQLIATGRKYVKLVQNLQEDDRAVASDYKYGKIILYITKRSFPFPNKLLGGSIIAPNAGEMVQELILANTVDIDINQLFKKTYPYPTSSRANKIIIMKHFIGSIRPWMKNILKRAYRIQA